MKCRVLPSNQAPLIPSIRSYHNTPCNCKRLPRIMSLSYELEQNGQHCMRCKFPIQWKHHDCHYAVPVTVSAKQKEYSKGSRSRRSTTLKSFFILGVSIWICSITKIRFMTACTWLPEGLRPLPATLFLRRDTPVLYVYITFCSTTRQIDQDI